MSAPWPLEPGAQLRDRSERETAPGEHEIELSKAISLKRLADALTGGGPSILTAPINSYGEGIGDAIQGQMIRGQRGVDQYEGQGR